MERIVDISRCSFNHGGATKSPRDDYVGLKIKTTEQDVLIGVNYCLTGLDEYGVYVVNRDPVGFTGSELIGVSVSDKCISPSKVPNTIHGGVMYINLETNVGVLQVAVYAAYCLEHLHSAVVVSNQLTRVQNLGIGND